MKATKQKLDETTSQSDIIVRVSELPLDRSYELSEDLVEKAVKELPLRAPLESEKYTGDSGSAEVAMYSDGKHVHVSGSIVCNLTVACVRCLEPTTVSLHEPFRTMFVPAVEMPADDDIEDLDPEEADAFPFDGQEVDLTPVLMEQIVLSVPFSPVCKQDCQGLCVQCGVNQNQTTCRCDQENIDPRFAALKTIKL